MVLSIETALKRPSDVPGTPYFSRYMALKERVFEHEYGMTMAGFPGGNDHGPNHIKRVLVNLDRLLGAKPLRHLSQYELFLAMTGVLYHDVGILRGRKDHAATSAQLLTEDRAGYIFTDEDKVFLSAIVLSHSSSVSIDDGPQDQYVRGHDIRPRLVAALVRIADELDEDVRRADPLLREKLELPKESEFYWRFNKRIRGVKVDNTRKEIVFNVAFDPEDIGFTEDGITDSFIELSLKKILKVNHERVYCNKFLIPQLAMKQIRITLQPTQGAGSRAIQLILEDDATFDSLRSQIPPNLLSQSATPNSSKRKTSKPPARKNKQLSESSDAVINGYKLFFFRTGKQLSIRELSLRSGVETRFINNLEQVKIRVPAPQCFKSAPRAALSAIERALDCVGKLEYGQEDDLLATYLMYYNVNHKPAHGTSKTAPLDFAPDTKAVVFDFGGTLTRTVSAYSTWERMWLAVGYSIDDAGHLLKLFRAKQLSHQEWCDLTCAKLREKKFSRKHMRDIMATIEPVDGLKETVTKLHEQGIALYIVSGSIREIVATKLGDSFSLFTEVKANDINYDGNEIISEIRGHPFDFEGKGTFIRRVFEELRCDQLEVLFVGNSLNDTWASQSGARTLCVNPANVDYTNTLIWNNYIQEMKNLCEILPYAKRQPALVFDP